MQEVRDVIQLAVGANNHAIKCHVFNKTARGPRYGLYRRLYAEVVAARLQG